MKTNINIIKRYSYGIVAALLFGSTLMSCDSILEEKEVDCSINYSVKFKYDYNMKHADAFANEVKSVTLYAFNNEGKLVYQKTEEGDVLKQDGYAMDVDMNPGDYHLIAWAGLNDDDSFSVPLVSQGASIEDLRCRMDRVYTKSDEQGGIINTKLSSLFHGQVVNQNFVTRAPINQEIIVPLVKNTNTVKIILHQMDGVTIPADDLEFTITDNNGYMDYDNTLLEDEKLTYYSYHHESGSVVEESQTKSGEVTNISFATAELTVGRLMKDQNAVLTIRNKVTDETILRIPVIKMFLLAKLQGQYDMDDQEYLDRQDEYKMTFFLDENMKWIDSQIIINEWIVRFDDMSF